MFKNSYRQLVESTGIQLDGPNPWDIQVRDERWIDRVLREKNLGLGESYMDGWWDCARIDEMLCRMLRSDLAARIRGNWRDAARYVAAVVFNHQARRRARTIAKRHYDLGNDLFFSFLDPEYKQYSCAYFEGTDDLRQAQKNKLALIAGKLDLQSGDHLLDIGCGWGGLAKFAARERDCRVTAVNISKEQLKYAHESCAGLPVAFRDCDYRSIEGPLDTQGKFDKIVSVGMFEHVGPKNYRAFMDVAHRNLKDEGIFLLHTIGANVSGAGDSDPWISKYIFPNSGLPSIAQIAEAAEGRFVIEDLHNLGPHYDKTLMAWHANFVAAWPSLKASSNAASGNGNGSDNGSGNGSCNGSHAKYDERFRRMWEYYLLSCAAAFRARDIQLWQFVMTKQGTGTKQPNARKCDADAA